MTDRKPKGSTPLAPHRPLSSQSAASNGSTPAKAESAPTQAIPKVPSDQPTNGQSANAGSAGNAQSAGTADSTSTDRRPAQTTGTQNAAPQSTGAQTTANRTLAQPKTAGEIAAEVGNPPTAPPKKQTWPQQQPTTPTTAAAVPATDPAAARTARLRLARIDPWSVMKVSFALSIAIAIVTVIAISIVWFVLGAAGVWDAVNSSVATLLSDNAESFDITEYVGYGRVIGFALLVSAVDVVLITAIATLGAFLYNLAASLLGGLELTLAEDG